MAAKAAEGKWGRMEEFAVAAAVIAVVDDVAVIAVVDDVAAKRGEETRSGWET
eukprot:CAMPEP_0175085292 /NCGR_PEP_ID=MMETSP0052_2-20121109/28571_1 /TAXON_ID=51329 ORGANISM="Polytomella parva, Strain SAG 63-3" /NCGR_SAMPLE_ID=MMETSP0052_2 /ASSEMBLY_ACC=CAM_ASM_000194 /LENGTH=52 /DNA_ID=CAMNT_0016357265 /DNA_START=1 /DNA_END=156 /DNA_ORIENTATION=+